MIVAKPRISRVFASATRIAAGALIAAGLGAVQPAPVQARSAPYSFADLAEALSPAVVNISTSQNVGVSGKDGPLEDLFKDLYPDGRPDRRRKVQSLGSGFVISKDGYIVTNNHVIKNADEITVNFADGLSLKAFVVGTDPQTDIALLRVRHSASLPFVVFGDSDRARVGDWVMAIGNPFGFSGSVSAGIISARNRDIRAGRYDNFIQTDAAINRGNSGGPLFNLNGEVIGVNTAIFSPTGASIGLGFSVPSNLAKRIADQLREFGVVRRGWLGVRIQPITNLLVKSLGLPGKSGAYVADVTGGGPAEKGGVQAKDVIVDFDGQRVKTMRDLPRLVADTDVNKTVRVTVIRRKTRLALYVRIGLLNEGKGKRPGGKIPPPKAAPKLTKLSQVGLTLRPLDKAARSEFKIRKDVTGVLIAAVIDGGSAKAKGVRPGDVIVEVGQEPVTTPGEVARQVAAAITQKRKSVLFLIQSGGDLRFVPLRLSP